jgi:hypothetical protein
MGNPRPRPALLHKKLIAVRDYLDVSQEVFAEWLKLPHAGRLAEYERDFREPNLMVLLNVSRFAQVHMETLADDQVGLDEFRRQLGTVEPARPEKQSQIVEPPQEVESRIDSKKGTKPVTLINGTH